MKNEKKNEKKMGVNFYVEKIKIKLISYKKIIN